MKITKLIITFLALFSCTFEGISLSNPQILSPEALKRSKSLIDTLDTAQNHNPLPAAPTDSQKGFKDQLDKAFNTLTNQVRIVHTLILQSLDTCHLNLQYWYQQQTHPLYYFIRKGPAKWFKGEAQEVEIQGHIDALKQAIELYAHHLGYVCMTIPRLQHSNNLQELTTTMHAVALDINALLHAKMPHDKSFSENVSIAAINSILKENQELLLQAPLLEKKLLSRHKKPDHLTRNWLVYSGLTVAGLYALYYYRTHTGAVDTFVRRTQTSTAQFIESHVKEPLHKIWDTFYGKQPDNAPKQLLNRSTTNESLAADIEIERASRLEWLSNRHPEISPEQARKLVDDALENDMLPTILREDRHALFGKEMGTKPVTLRDPLLGMPVLNVDGKKYNPQFLMFDILFGHYDLMITKLNRRVSSVWPLVEKNLKDADQIMKANKINFQLMLTIPALVVVGGLTSVGKTVGSWYTKSLYKPLKDGLLNIEVLLNRYNRPELTLDTYAYGLIHYWVFKLSNMGYLVVPSLKQNYLRDLAELDNNEFNVTQKLGTITRMYRTYGFLAIN